MASSSSEMRFKNCKMRYVIWQRKWFKWLVDVTFLLKEWEHWKIFKDHCRRWTM